MYQTETDTGVTLRSCKPLPTQTLKDRNVVVFLLWSWSFTIRNNVGGLFKKGQW